MRSTRTDLSTVEWRKSSYSDGGSANCLEVADGLPAGLPVRDSKCASGPVLVFPVAGWAAFVDGVRGERL